MFIMLRSNRIMICKNIGATRKQSDEQKTLVFNTELTLGISALERSTCNKFASIELVEN